MNMYKRNNVVVTRLLNSIDLHILHSMNPDGFEKSKEGACLGDDGRQNANNVRILKFIPPHCACPSHFFLMLG